jgi:hypothetical protein
VVERSWVSSDGRIWTFRLRPDVRKDETNTHVILLAESLGETRIVSCLRSEWERLVPDLGSLLARSVPEGGSRGVGPGPAPKAEPPDDPY